MKNNHAATQSERILETLISVIKPLLGYKNIACPPPPTSDILNDFLEQSFKTFLDYITFESYG